MSVTVFVEGGGDGENTLRQCRQGFAAYCGKLAPTGRRPKIVACGGRNQAFDKFKTAIRLSEEGDICALLVDAEAPITAANAVQHLAERDGWEFPEDLNGHQIFLMAQAMEAWFMADREVLGEFYDGGFLANSLPGSATDVESIRKNDLEPRLRHATASTRTKGEYHKVKHGFDLLAAIDPMKVENGSPNAKEFNDFLRSL